MIPLLAFKTVINNDLIQLNKDRYPVWAAMAGDYLGIQASSVSSERAFSSAGITITKRRNRLKGDIVEAIQVLKCKVKGNVMRSTAQPSLSMEEKLEALTLDEEHAMEDVEKEVGTGGGNNSDSDDADDLLLSDDDCFE